MPANSGAITGTVDHNHSAPSAEGGFLLANTTGMTGTGSGSLIYFDGSSIAQNLTLGNPSESLVVNAGGTAPEWSAGGSATSILTLVSHTTVPANTTTIDVTFAEIELAGLSEIYIVTAGSNGGNEVGMQIYDQTSTLLTGSLYRHAGLLTVTGVQHIIDSGTGNTSILVAPTSIEPHAAVVHLMLGGAGNNLKYNVQVAGGNGTGNAFATLGGWYAANGVTGISGIKLGITGSDSIERETYMDIYKRSNA